MDCKGTRKALLSSPSYIPPCWSVSSSGPGRAGLSEMLLVGDGFAQTPFSDSSPGDESLPHPPVRWFLSRILMRPHCPSVCHLLSLSPGWDIHRICPPVLYSLAPRCHLVTRGLEAFSFVRQTSRHLSWRRPGVTLVRVGIRE